MKGVTTDENKAEKDNISVLVLRTCRIVVLTFSNALKLFCSPVCAGPRSSYSRNSNERNTEDESLLGYSYL
jgi:hypothetical protein